LLCEITPLPGKVGCIDRTTQPDGSMDVRSGSSVEMLRLSISRLLFMTKADLPWAWLRETPMK
jgi:hypothetical protein